MTKKIFIMPTLSDIPEMREGQMCICRIKQLVIRKATEEDSRNLYSRVGAVFQIAKWLLSKNHF